MIKSLFLICGYLGLSASALAAGGGHAGEHHGVVVPTTTIFWQTFNVVILFSALTYLLKSPIKKFFINKKNEYAQNAEKSLIAKKNAEKEYLDLLHKIEHLEASHSDSVSRAEAEALDLEKQIVKEAQELARRISSDADEIVRQETASLKRELFEGLIKKATTAARQTLAKDTTAADHQRLQEDLTRGLQEVKL
jgi:F0F1-type ATP synthase membrane subunit b/b'